MENALLKTDFNPNIDINLCCGNCIYKLVYSYITRNFKNYNLSTKAVTHILCLAEKTPKQLTVNNQFKACMTCKLHSLGNLLGGDVLPCPTNLEMFNFNYRIKILLNFRPDIVARFKDIDLIQRFEIEENNKWNKLNNT